MVLGRSGRVVVSPPEDLRWETMQYHLQVHLKRSFDDDVSFLEPED